LVELIVSGALKGGELRVMQAAKARMFMIWVSLNLMFWVRKGN
jgi:hypothetical protein